MKKIVFLFATVFLLGSCTIVAPDELQESDRFKIYVKSESHTSVIDILPFDYAGHSYIYFNAPNEDGQILHDPDCKKCERQ